MMDQQQRVLYERLQGYKLDDEKIEHPFSQHLAKANGWSVDYTQRVIEEYKKFVFLCIAANHRVAPPDSVDQVWHLHILHSQAYWQEFCPNILKHDLHHQPAQGGRPEREAFHHWYDQTLESYQQFFGEPPLDIWPPAYRRFGIDLQMRRVNTHENWVIPKRLPAFPRPQKSWGIILIALLATGCSQQGFLLTSQNHLLEKVPWVLYGIILFVGHYIRQELKRPIFVEEVPQLSPEEMAYLAGGAQRVIDLTLTQLVHQEYLSPNAEHRTFNILRPLSSENSRLQIKAIAQVEQNCILSSIRSRLKPATLDLKLALQSKGLLLTLRQQVYCYLIPLFLTGATGFWLTSQNQTGDFWVVALIGVATLLIPPNRSRWGDRILTNLRATRFLDLDHIFALHGPQVLSGGVLDDLKDVFLPPSDSETGGCGCGC